MRRTPQLLAALAISSLVVVGSVAVSGAGTVMAPATMVVSNTNPVEGELITVTNADNDASRCTETEGVYLTVEGAPIAHPWMQLVPVDAEGNWEAQFPIPIQSEFSNAYVGGPFTVGALCTPLPSTDLGAQAEGPFEYVPVVITLRHDVPVEQPTFDQEPAFSGPAAAIEVAPHFTG